MLCFLNTVKLSVMNDNNETYNELNKTGNENPFTVPKNYFEEFPEKLNKRLKEEQKDDKPNVISLMKPYLAAAAIFIGLFFAWSIVLEVYIDDTPNKVAFVEDDTVNDFDNFIEEELYSIDEDIIWEVYNNPDEIESNASLASIETESLIDYLSDEDIDYETITERL